MHDLVMIGSSIFEFWQQPRWHPLKVANNAVRGSQSQYWCHSDLSVLPKAKHYLVYCGSNDLIYGVCPKQTVENIKTVLTQLLGLHPSAKVGYFSIMKCPQKETAGQLDIIDGINKQINSFINQNKDVSCNTKKDNIHQETNGLHYFDFNDYIENNAKWFLDDGLHLTNEAYQMLDEKLQPILARWIGSAKI